MLLDYTIFITFYRYLMETGSNNELMKKIKGLKYFNDLHSCPSGVCQEKHYFMCAVDVLLIF